jgi:hypothetical protein
MSSNAVVHKSTPVLTVDRIEPAVQFWKKLGLMPTTAVPDTQANDGRLAFVILAGGGVEIMYQTIASIKEDLLKAASIKVAFPATPQQTILFVEVSQLGAVEDQLRGEPLIMPRRTTFYGSTEIGYADPGGNVIVFAETGQDVNALSQ